MSREDDTPTSKDLIAAAREQMASESGSSNAMVESARRQASDLESGENQTNVAPDRGNVTVVGASTDRVVEAPVRETPDYRQGGGLSPSSGQRRAPPPPPQPIPAPPWESDRTTARRVRRLIAGAVLGLVVFSVLNSSYDGIRDFVEEQLDRPATSEGLQLEAADTPPDEVPGADPSTAALRGDTPESTLVVEVDTTLAAEHIGDVFIAADNIVLDCAGFAIEGQSAVGIGIFERSGVTIRNCPIAGFDIGVVLVGSNGITLEGNTLAGDSTAVGVTQGILLDAAYDNTIAGHSITGYAIGINLINSSDNLIEGNTITGTGGKWGIGMLDDSIGNHVAGNDTSRTEAGILLARGASSNEITGNNSSHNSKGFEATNSFDNTFTANLATDNDFAGFWLAGSDGNTVAANDIQRGGFGIVVQGCDANLFESNKIDGTRDWFAFGISEASEGNIVSSNEVVGGGAAFAVYIGANGNTFSDNKILNSKKGFAITDAGSTGNLITANEITGATEIGLHDGTSGSGNSGTGNTYADNVCSRNATDSVPGDLCNG